MAGVNDSLSFSTAEYGQLRIHEGVVYCYYNDLGPHSGNCTWGGTLAHFGVCTDEELKRPVTASDINTALAKHVHKVERYIRRKVPHHRLIQAQFDGLASFIYNVSDPSAVMEAVDHGDMTAVHDKMLQYIYVFKHDAKGCKVGKPKILAPLYKRRLEETARLDRNNMIKKLSLALLLTLCVPTAVFAGSDKETDARLDTLTGADSHGQYHQFLNQLQKAVKEKDKKAVAAMVDYPITVTVNHKETDIADSHAFVQAYDSVFTDRLVNIILHQTYADLFVNSTGVMVGPQGELWFSGLCSVKDCSKFDIKIMQINN